MFAISIKEPLQTALIQTDLPDLAPDDVRIKVRATGICATDIEIYEGTMAYFTRGMASYPVTPGHEWVGDIVALGSTVSGFQIGDRVVGEVSLGCTQCLLCRAGHYHRCENRCETGILNRDGAFAEFIVHPAQYLHKIDPSVSIEAAAMVEPTAVAFMGVTRAKVTPSDYVVVFGDGPIGLLLLQVALAFSARQVVVVGATDHRLQMATEIGASDVFHVESTPDIPAALAQINGGELPDVVLEATGNPDAAYQALHSAKPGGRVVFQGLFAGKKLEGFDLDQIVINDLTVSGSLASPNVWPDVIRLIESGRVQPDKIVTHQFSLDTFDDALSCALERVGIKMLVVQV